jgi:hypothetical protein
MAEHRVLTITDIPSVDERPAGPTAPSAAGQALRKLATRRTVLRFVGGAGMTIGLTVVGWLPPLRKAYADWFSRYPEYPTCAGFFNPSTICTPPSWFIDSSVCNGVSFHRDDSKIGDCFSYSHTVHKTTCAGRNAWRWNDTRCSDGHLFYQDCGGAFRNTNSICRGPAV